MVIMYKIRKIKIIRKRKSKKALCHFHRTAKERALWFYTKKRSFPLIPLQKPSLKQKGFFLTSFLFLVPFCLLVILSITHSFNRYLQKPYTYQRSSENRVKQSLPSMRWVQRGTSIKGQSWRTVTGASPMHLRGASKQCSGWGKGEPP